MTRCLTCLANATNLSLIPVIQMHRQVSTIETAWEMSTFGATHNYLKHNIQNLIESEYFKNNPCGELVNGTLNQDVQNLTFPDASLDLISSNQVFEHVQDDMQGFKECYRVLKFGGALIFSIPLYSDISTTQRLAMVNNGKIEFLTPPEYHDSRHGGPQSALCFWRHSFFDITERVSSVGFNSRLIDIRLPNTTNNPAFIVYAVKA